ncbi:MAG: methyltransferase domain-containing protein [Verrucomicrobia bacterium]|nr:methyltransferase domain-containing protein [Cytophagales bacterium]
MFKKRSYETEVMDDLQLGGNLMTQTLHELDFINRWLGGNIVTITGIKQLLSNYATQPDKPINIADLGCGSGDLMKIMVHWARKKDLMVKITGIDANDFIINHARNNSSQYGEISYENLNVFAGNFQNLQYDIITCTLFCHHFTDDELIILFKSWKQQAQIGIVVNDLHRHWVAYHAIKWLTQWFSKSSMVKNDAKLSVARAFLRKELESVLAQAGITDYTISWHWAFRWKIVINTK